MPSKQISGESNFNLLQLLMSKSLGPWRNGGTRNTGKFKVNLGSYAIRQNSIERLMRSHQKDPGILLESMGIYLIKGIRGFMELRKENAR